MRAAVGIDDEPRSHQSPRRQHARCHEFRHAVAIGIATAQPQHQIGVALRQAEVAFQGIRRQADEPRRAGLRRHVAHCLEAQLQALRTRLPANAGKREARRRPAQCTGGRVLGCAIGLPGPGRHEVERRIPRRPVGRQRRHQPQRPAARLARPLQNGRQFERHDRFAQHKVGSIRAHAVDVPGPRLCQHIRSPHSERYPAMSDPINSVDSASPSPDNRPRRRFMRYLTLLGVGGQALVRSGNLSAAVTEGRTRAGLEPAWPEMAYRTLGRTGFRASRLVFGCGAALSRKPRDELLSAALDAGVNVFDVGFKHYYDDAEKHLAPFLKRLGNRRDDIFLISKAIAPTDAKPNDDVSSTEAAKAAQAWSALLDESLGELGVDHVDAYYLMAAHNPSLIRSEEILRAFERAREAGKVSHLGVSTHQNASRVLASAAATGMYSLAMIAITPGGWYDWETRKVLPDSAPMKDLQDELAAARQAGMGLIGMKAGRYLAGRSFLGWGNPDAFDRHYEPKLLKAKLSEFQRSYAFVLEHGLDAVNADMQNIAHLKENFVAAATSNHYFSTTA